MYDNHNLERSKSYFVMLQARRIFADSISESREELAHTIFYSRIAASGCSLSQDPFGEAKIVEWNWQVLEMMHERVTKRFLDRIDRKFEQVKSLRDGVRREIAHTTPHPALQTTNNLPHE